MNVVPCDSEENSDYGSEIEEKSKDVVVLPEVEV
jgi:hypothetical protein